MSANRDRVLAQAWFAAAQKDVELADLVLRSRFFASACFTCQQAAEKALKAYLLARGRGLVRMHFLPGLLQECQIFDAGFAGLLDACLVLTSYYTDTRYPESPEGLDAFDAATALQALGLAHLVVEHVQKAMRATLGS